MVILEHILNPLEGTKMLRLFKKKSPDTSVDDGSHLVEHFTRLLSDYYISLGLWMGRIPKEQREGDDEFLITQNKSLIVSRAFGDIKKEMQDGTLTLKKLTTILSSIFIEHQMYLRLKGYEPTRNGYEPTEHGMDEIINEINDKLALYASKSTFVR
jgi:hypothetical protein